MKKEERHNKMILFEKMLSENFKLKDISKEIGVPERTLKSWISKNKNRFKKGGVDLDILVKMKIDGCSNKDVSKNLNISESTVVKCLSNARIDYIDYFNKNIVSVKEVITKDFQLFCYLKLELKDKFSIQRYKRVFLDKFDTHKANYFDKKVSTTLFSEHLFEYFRECICIYNDFTEVKVRKIRKKKCKLKNNVIYRFLNKDDNAIYIGKALNLKSRLNSHKHNGHLPEDCYNNVCRIEYIELQSSDDMDLVERLLIAKHKPMFNTEFVDKNFTVVDMSMDDFEWKTSDFELLKTKEEI